jgi:archaetidylinositol phosphate synthase
VTDPTIGAALRRQNDGILQFIERPTLRWLAGRMPARVSPDMLTAIGFAGMVIAAVGYGLASRDPAMLWLASAGLLINWFGDSLDGTVARVRGIERPRYGFFLDNSVDVLEYAVFAIGMGLSGYLRWELAFAGLAAFYMMMLIELINARATDVLQIAFAGVGLTEVRAVFIVLNAVMFFVPPTPFSIAGVTTTYPNVISALWIMIQVATYLVVMIKTLRTLAAKEPPRRAPRNQIWTDRPA